MRLSRDLPWKKHMPVWIAAAQVASAFFGTAEQLNKSVRFDVVYINIYEEWNSTFSSFWVFISRVFIMKDMMKGLFGASGWSWISSNIYDL